MKFDCYVNQYAEIEAREKLAELMDQNKLEFEDCYIEPSTN